MSDQQFYLTLPSNASLNIYPDNTLSDYTTRLFNPIQLSGRWEVGLSEIQYPHCYFNITDRNNSLSYSESGRLTRYLKIPHGYYGSVQEVLDTINDYLIDEAKSSISLVVDKKSRKVLVRLKAGAFITFNDDLYKLLGLPRKAFFETTAGTQPSDIYAGVYGLYVYSDIVEPQYVGDANVPLLKIVPLKTGSKTAGDMISTSYSMPHYIPVKTKHFDVINVNIRDDTGRKFAFERGKVVVKLHFRQVRPSLFQ